MKKKNRPCTKHVVKQWADLKGWWGRSNLKKRNKKKKITQPKNPNNVHCPPPPPPLPPSAVQLERKTPLIFLASEETIQFQASRLCLRERDGVTPRRQMALTNADSLHLTVGEGYSGWWWWRVGVINEYLSVSSLSSGAGSLFPFSAWLNFESTGFPACYTHTRARAHTFFFFFLQTYL